MLKFEFFKNEVKEEVKEAIWYNPHPQLFHTDASVRSISLD